MEKLNSCAKSRKLIQPRHNQCLRQHTNRDTNTLAPRGHGQPQAPCGHGRPQAPCTPNAASGCGYVTYWKEYGINLIISLSVLQLVCSRKQKAIHFCTQQTRSSHSSNKPIKIWNSGASHFHILTTKEEQKAIARQADGVGDQHKLYRSFRPKFQSLQEAATHENPDTRSRYCYRTCKRRQQHCALIIKPTRCNNFSNLFLEQNSACFGQFLCPSSGVQYRIHSNRYMPHRFC